MKTNNKSIYFFLLLIFVLSCEKDRDENSETIEEPSLYSYHYKNMDTPGIDLPTNTDGIISIEHDSQGRPTKRNGGFVGVPLSSGFECMFSKDIYDEIDYRNNDIIITQKSVSQPEQLYIYQKHFSLLNGKIVQKATTDIFADTINDTIQYYYSGNKLTRSLKKQQRPISETKYHYNAQGNLDSIVTRRLVYNPVNQQYEPYSQYPKMRTLEIFKNYDNYANPTKKLMLFDEIFNRSLSENNYSRYEKKVFDIDGNLTLTLTKTWTFSYTNGKIDFTR
ncbi:hypothetical protein D3C87_436210 [compost metagenome]